MTNADFWKSIDSILQKDWDLLSLHQMDTYGELFRTGKLLYQRFSPLEQRGFLAGGDNHVVASILAGAEVAADLLSAPIDSFQRERQLE